ncbi:alpha/beta hydrolase [Sediminibacillus albus]|uniref:Uncharacterized protein with an alpha/beta hydrolase fold n=1 Tax=Sediminibacillus albus TaxID=407036 RepID=A0A1G9AJ80_9BACI|nr:alpha/beta hydrolase [Sediminibacillus albus]SDK27402.1 Uncharacterized protein with an alpha/beta hydrolase fold [Sediminibacillus albus]
MEKLKHHKYSFLLFLLLFFIIISSFTFINSKQISSQDNSKMIPTVFVHGFKGGPGSFRTMLDRMEASVPDTKRMVFRVNEEGEVSIKGRYSGQLNPFIQVVFERNRASLANQTIWLQKVMAELHGTYGFEKINLIGHSMGGLASTNFLLTKSTKEFPIVQNLIVIGSPFQGITAERYYSANSSAAAVDLRFHSDALLSMEGKKDNLPEEVNVLAIAGVINSQPSQTDGLVELASALGIKDLVPAEQYTEKVFYDSKAGHSDLHEHVGVDRAVSDFLWSTEKVVSEGEID